MQSALLWYRTFKTKLQLTGFKLNKYDPCVANKMINGHQCTILWYVDDSKISHKDPRVVSEVIKTLEDTFGEMTGTRGKKHTFVGMDIEFKEDGKVELSMREYLQECINTFGEAFNGGAKTPARPSLFEIDKDSGQLCDRKKDIFHRIVAKLLFVAYLDNVLYLYSIEQ